MSTSPRCLQADPATSPHLRNFWLNLGQPGSTNRQRPAGTLLQAGGHQVIRVSPGIQLDVLMHFGFELTAHHRLYGNVKAAPPQFNELGNPLPIGQIMEVPHQTGSTELNTKLRSNLTRRFLRPGQAVLEQGAGHARDCLTTINRLRQILDSKQASRKILDSIPARNPG